MAEPRNEVAIGKFDILATYTLAKGLLDGLAEDEAKERGMVAAVMGAQARLGVRRKHEDDHRARKEAAEKKRKSTITAASFDHQVADKMGGFFAKVVLAPDHDEARAGGSVLRCGQSRCRYPLDVGCQDQRRAVPGTSRRSAEGPQREVTRPLGCFALRPWRSRQISLLPIAARASSSGNPLTRNRGG